MQLESLRPAPNNTSRIRIQAHRNYEASDGGVILLHNIPQTLR